MPKSKTDITVEIQCCKCKTAKKTTKQTTCDEPVLPRGWKQIREDAYCAVCWAMYFVCRPQHVAVESVSLDGMDAESSWKEFRKALLISWRQAAQASNLMLAHLFALDTEPLKSKQSKDGKRTVLTLPEFPKLNLYQVGRMRFPEVDSQSMGSLALKVGKRYREDRWAIRVECTKSLSTFKVPTPLPIPSGGIKLFQENNQIFISARIAGQRFKMRLSTEGRRWRQTAAIQKVLQGEGKLAEVVIRGQNAGGAHQNGLIMRIGPSANRRPVRVMVAVSCWLPKGNGTGATEEKILDVVTCKESMWKVTVDGREEGWNLHEDHLQRLVLSYCQRLQRMSDDEKFERRVPSLNKNFINDYRNRLGDRQRRRLNDAIHKASRMLVGFCQRLRVTEVRYCDDKERFLEKFPWFKLRTAVKQKLEEVGISFTLVESVNDSKTEE